MVSLESRIKVRAGELGFDLVGIAPAVSPSGVNALRDWLNKGFAGEMNYMHRHAAAREHPQAVLPDVKSVVMAGMNYRTGTGSQGSGVRNQESDETTHDSPLTTRQSTGRVSCYAWGDDYHELLRQRLRELLKFIQEQSPGTRGRAVVDTAPLLERDFARLAGLGWFGKNTMLLNKRLGSYFFLGALLLDLELQPDQPFEANHCGTCTACLDACPTKAFVGPGQLDARRCISYLTIELRGPIPGDLREPMGDWIFGCDICQDVCPWNRKSPLSTEPAFQAREGKAELSLMELLQMSPEQFRQHFAGTTITRAKRAGLLRNAAVALGNLKDLHAVPALIAALRDEEPLVRGAAAWALGRIGSKATHAALRTRLSEETDERVCAELKTVVGRAARRGC